MKKNNVLNFLGLPCCGDSSLKLDFSKSNDFGSGFSESSKTKSRGVGGIVMLFMLFLFSNFLTAQVKIDGLSNSYPEEWTQDGITHVADSFNIVGQDNIFAGNEKDFFYANNWFWKLGTAKDKNDIANGAATLLPAGQVFLADGSAAVGGPFIVFAGDRISNSGDAQIGFWFFQDGTHPLTVSGVNLFTPAKHLPPVIGDILVLADFTNGGNIGAITVLEWVGTGGNYSGNAAFNAVSLAAAVAENNGGTTPVPTGWVFKDKNNSNPLTNTTQYGTNEFYEGYVNLAALGGAQACFSGFMLETRSTHTITSTLDDFVGGALGGVPTVEVGATTITCNGGSATVTATANPPGVYTYTWTVPVGATPQGFGVSSFSTSVPGTYSVYITNENGCASDPDSVEVTAPPALTCNAVATNPLCNSGTGSITVTPTGGTGTKTYTISGGNTTGATSGVFTGLAAGTYTVTTTDANNCTTTCQATITAPPALTCNAVATNPLCNNGTGSITVTPTGGTGTKTYTISGGNTTGATSGIFTGLAAGTYTVTTTDANNCTTTCQATIVIPPALTCNAVATNPLCNNGTGSITVTPTGGTGTKTYTISGGNTTGATSGVFTGLAAGTYTVTTTDANNCTTTCQATITAPPALTCNAVATNPLCNNGTGSITVTPTGGTGVKTYTISGGNTTGATSGIFTGLAAGTYTVTTTDANNCTTTCQATITAPPALTCNAVATNPLCNNGTGSITVTPTGGTGTKTYTISGGNTTGATSGVFTGLAAGTYTVTTTDANNCTTTCQATITAPPALTCNAVATNPLCNNGTGSITVTPTGGTGTKTYTISGGNTTGATSGVFTGLAAGTYTVTTTDANNCTTTCQATITAPPALTCNAVATNPLCNNGTGSITVTPTGGTGVKTYTISGGNTTGATSGIFTGLAAGTYTVTTTDANNCTTTCQATITAPPALTCNAVATNPLCNNGTGSITVTPTGGTGTKTYTISGGNTTGATSGIFTGLAAGTYTVTTTDANNCTTTCQATITAPPALTCNAVATNPLCSSGEAGGTITVTPTGGTGVKTYTISGGNTTGATSGVFTGLANGTYTVTTTDANNCTTTCQATITPPPALSCNAVATNPLCNSGTGSITVTPTGGTGTKTYTISGGNTTGATSGIFTGLAAGTYTVTTTDANNCTTTCQATIVIPPALSCNAVATNPLCNNGTGSITVTPTGGTGVKTYTISGGNTTGATSGIFTGLAAGTYTVTTTDANNCTTTCQATITAPPALTCNAVATNPLCNNGTGSIAVTPTGGTGVKTYTISGGNTTGATSGVFTGLAAGTYTVTTTDANNCTTTCQATIVIPPALTCNAVATNPLCNNGTGSITVTPTGGTGVKTYTISGGNTTGATSGVFTGLAAGTYTVTTTDANNCTTTCQATIVIPPALTCNAVATNPLCNNGTGSITVTPTGGTGTKNYTISGGNTTGATSGIFTGLAAGTYTVTTTDANNCTTTCQATIVIPPALSCNAVATNPLCNNGTGSITVTPTGGTGVKTYTISGGNTTGATSGIFTGLAAGTYTVTTTDANNCTTTCQATITAPPALTCNAVATNPLCNNGTGSIAVTPTGGTGVKTYTISGGNTTGATSGIFTGLAAGTYTVTTTDANNCTTTCQATIVIPPALTCNAVATNPLCNNGTGSITVTPTGGTGVKTYTISGGNTTGATSGVFTGLAAGTYTVTTTDANNCTTTCQATIVIPPALSCNAVATNPLCNNGTGSITVTPTGGTGTKTYTISGGNTTGATSGIFTGLAAGTYTVTTTDANNCTTTCQATIVIPPALTCNAVATNPLCNNGTGSITVTPTGGTGTKTYTISGGNTTGATSGIFTGLAAGTYTVTTTDANNCTTTCQATITAPPALTCNAVATNPLCNNGTGSITVTPTGGTGTKTYTISGGNTTGATSGVFTGLAAGTYTVTTTDANNCTTTCQATITVPTAVELSLTSLPEVCANTATGSIEATFSGGTGVYTVSIDGSSFTEQASPYTFANLGTGSHTVVVRDANGCEATDEINVDLIPCEHFCTYTQGAYGSAGGAMCDGTVGNLTTAGMIAQTLANAGGTITLGTPGHSVVMTAPSAVSCIIDVLPGGGGAKELPAGDNNVCSLPNSLLKLGRVNNSLLAQTMTLALNANIDLAANLGGFPLQAGIIATADPLGGCGSEIAEERVCGHYNELGVWVNTVNEYTYKTISAAVVNAITPNGNGDRTVAGLIDLASRALGNADGIHNTENGVSLSAISAAEDALNNVFDECKIFVGWNVAPCPARPAPIAKQSLVSGLSLVAYPNPFAGNFKIDVKTSSNEDLQVKVYDALGRLLQTNTVKVTNVDTFQIGNNYPSGVYNVIVTQGTETKTQRVIKK